MKRIKRIKIGPYRLAAHLDSGGMAEVFLASGPGPDDLGVIKILLEHLVGQEEILAMFRDEGRIMSALAHENVVSVHDTGIHERRPWLAMEYLAGDHLGMAARLVRRAGEKMSPTLVAGIALQAARGLDYVHRACDAGGRALSLVHRDISPQNIFLCYDGRICLLDFGVALSAEREAVTRTGLLKGKVAYMSPEQIRYQDLDGRSDLFALGVVMWEMLLGQRLFKCKSEFDTLKKICDEGAPRVRDLRPELPAGLDEIIHRCLRRDRDQRMPQAAELIRALEEYLADERAAGDELTSFIARTMAERAAQKRAIVDSIRRDGALQMHLFYDLEDPGGDAGSAEVELTAPPPAPLVDRTPAREPEALPPQAPASPAEETPADEAPAPAAAQRPRGSSRRSRAPLWIILALLAGGLAIFLLITMPDRSARVPPDQATIPPPSGVLVTESHTHHRAAKGEIAIDCDRPVRAVLEGRSLGMTPISRRLVTPGRHQIRLIDPNSGESRILTVEAQTGRRLHYKIVF